MPGKYFEELFWRTSLGELKLLYCHYWKISSLLSNLSFVFYSWESLSNDMFWCIDSNWFKREYRPVAKIHCPNILSFSSKTRNLWTCQQDWQKGTPFFKKRLLVNVSFTCVSVNKYTINTEIIQLGWILQYDFAKMISHIFSYLWTNTFFCCLLIVTTWKLRECSNTQWFAFMFCHF